MFPLSSQGNLVNFHRLTTEEGLSESTNSFLYTDKRGFTWIGSLDGLNQFDGKEVTIFKANSNNPYAMRGIDIQSSFFEDSRGDIWFTTGEAINCYRRLEGNFTYYFMNEPQDSTLSTHYAFHLEKDKYLWIVANEKMFRCDIHLLKNEKHAPILDSFNVIRAAVDTDTFSDFTLVYGCYWNNRYGFDVIEFPKSFRSSKRTSWFDIPGNPGDSALVVTQVIPNIDAEACFLTNKGLLFFDYTDPYNYNLISFPADFQGVNSMEKVGKYLWLANNTSKIALFDLTKREFCEKRIHAFNIDEKANVKNIDQIFLGQDSILWVTAREKGVYFANMRNQQSFSIFSENDLDDLAIHNFYEDQENNVECFSIEGEGLKFDRQKKSTLLPSQPRFFHKIRLRDNQIWATSLKGVGKKDKQTSQFHWYPYSKSIRFFDVLQYDNRHLLLGTSEGLLLFDIDKKQYSSLGNTGFIVMIFIDNLGRLWTANASDQLTVWKIQEGHPISIEKLNQFHNMGLMNDLVQDISRGIIWIATSKGLVSISEDTFEKKIVTEAEGLPNQYIRSILFDKYLNLWLSTNRGIIRFTPSSEGEQSFRSFTTRDGLSADEYVSGSALTSKTGELWFGSIKGVDIINPDFQNIGLAPKLAIKDLKIHDKPWVGDSSINLKKKINLSYRENTLTFELSAIEYTDPKRNRFKVYLIHNNGIDSSLIGTDNKITYANLSPGDYRFQFTACNAEGIWQANKYDLAIIITPPFYQTWWFRVLGIVLSIALIGFVFSFYYRYQRLELEKKLALQAERDRIANEMHDELGGGLSTIINASARAEKKKSLGEVKSILNRISQVSFSLDKNMRELIWAMDPENDTLKELIAHIRHYTAEFLSDNGINVRIKVPERIPDLDMTSQVRHNILLVVKEILHNILKHSQATEVQFDIITSDKFIISISDNGKGFEIESIKSRGYGLRSCTNRITSISGKIKWERLDSGGMNVTITLELFKKNFAYSKK